MRKALASAAGFLALTLAVPAFAGTVTDCPHREAPFSADSPLIDVLRSPSARAVFDKIGRAHFCTPATSRARVPTFA